MWQGWMLFLGNKIELGGNTLQFTSFLFICAHEESFEKREMMKDDTLVSSIQKISPFIATCRIPKDNVLNPQRQRVEIAKSTC